CAWGDPDVSLVAYDCLLPTPYCVFQDCDEQPFAWAWLIRPPADEVVSLTWLDALQHSAPNFERLPAGLEVLRFYLRKDPTLERICDTRRGLWSRQVWSYCPLLARVRHRVEFRCSRDWRSFCISRTQHSHSKPSATVSRRSPRNQVYFPLYPWPDARDGCVPV